MTGAKYLAAATLLIAAAILSSVIVFSVEAVRRWRGFLRIAAALPLLALVSVAVFIAVEVAREPTSHNLWPLEIVLWGIGLLAYLGILALIRRFIFR